MPVVGGATRGNLLASLLVIAERSLTVAQLATTDLWYANESASAQQVAAEMNRLKYDVAPVGDPPLRYVDLQDLLKSRGAVNEAAVPIDLARLVTWDLPLVDGIGLLASRPYYFVLESDQIRGLVTRSDLQRPAVSMVLFALILAIEMAIRGIIDATYANDAWQQELSSRRINSLNKVYDSRMQYNTEMSKLDCLIIGDTISLLRKNEGIRRRLNLPSGERFEQWQDRLKHLRDSLAHGSGLLDIWPNPEEAIKEFASVREFAKRAWHESGVGQASSEKGIVQQPPTVGSSNSGVLFSNEP